MLRRRVARNYTLCEIIERSRNSRRESLIVSPFYLLRRCVQYFFYPARVSVYVCVTVASIPPCLSSLLIRSSRDLIVCRSCREHDLASLEIRKGWDRLRSSVKYGSTTITCAYIENVPIDRLPPRGRLHPRRIQA